MNAEPDTTDVAASAVGAPEGANQKGQNQMTRENTELAKAIERLSDDLTVPFGHFAGEAPESSALVRIEDARLILSALSAAPIHEDDWSELEGLARATAEISDLNEGDWYVAEHFGSGFEPEDAAFIAAANPATILKLIASARSPHEGEGEPRMGEVRVMENGNVCRFIERELEGDKWEVLGALYTGPSSVEVERLREQIARLERLVAQRDRLGATSNKFWVRAAKAAIGGDTRELRNRVDMAEAPPADVALSRKQEPEYESIECPTCDGSGKIVEAATTTGANQHSACQQDCEDCDGAGRIVPTPGGEG